MRGAWFWLLGAVLALSAARAGDAGLLAEADGAYAASLAETQPEKARAGFARAAGLYERLLAENGENGRLYYNLGNCFFRQGDYARAVLNYRRAEEFMPNDGNLRRNLELARAKTGAAVAPAAEDAWRFLLFWHYDLPASARRAGALAAFAVFWAVLLLRLRENWRRRLSRGVLAVSALVALALGGSLLYENAVRAAHPAGVVLSAVTARQGDGAAYEPMFTGDLPAGTEFTVRETRRRWLKVALDGGRECWLPREAVALVRR